MKIILINKLEDLLKKDLNEVTFEIRAIQKEYQKILTSEFENAKHLFIEEGGKATEFEYFKNSDDQKFDDLIDSFSKLKKENDNKIAAEQAKNLFIRQEIIDKIKDISKLSDNIGSAVRMLSELQKKWKEVGPVSSHKYKDNQSEYSKACEDLYYNLKIFKDLHEHDLKRNFELKSNLIQKLLNLQSIQNIKEIEGLVKIYRNEWDEIGPVVNIKWESLKQQYKKVLDETYIRIKAHYVSIQDEKDNNLKLKKEIIAKVVEIINTASNFKPIQWNEASEKLILFQSEWKTLGRTSEKYKEKIWIEFRNVCNDFFNKKKQYFIELNQNFEANRKIKLDLILKAQELENSTDWKKTGGDLIKLQEIWKKNTSYGDKEEPKLFARFRKACNTFFDAKKKNYENLEISYQSNLLIKEEILNQINAYKLCNNPTLDHENLKKFSNDWIASGFVLIKDKKRINDLFYNRLDHLYDLMNLDKNEKYTLQFKNKINRLINSENAFELLSKESDIIKKNINELQSNLRTYDNNLGFFKVSKGNNGFMKEIEAKVEAEKIKINELTSKGKIITEELSKLKN